MSGGKIKRSRGSQPPSWTEVSTEIPRLPQGHGTFFNLLARKSPEHRPERSVPVLTASAAKRGIYRRVRQSAPSQPLGSRVSGRLFAQEPKQVAKKFSPEGDPTLEAACWPYPRNLFSVSQPEPPSYFMIKHYGRKIKRIGKDF